MSKEILSHLGDTLRQIRLSKHLTQRELAVQIDRHRSYISAIENGSKAPPLPMLMQLADILDVSVDALLGLIEIGDLDLSSPSGVVRISKYIEFPAEHYQAGLSILTYFSTVLRQQVPETKAKVRIEQEGLAVRLVVETPSGERQVIEKTLHEYGLVVTGKMKADQLLSDPQQVIQLVNKLELAHTELRMVTRQLEFERTGHQNRIAGLEDEVAWLRQHVGGLLAGQNQGIDALAGAILHLTQRPDVKRDEVLVDALSLISTLLERSSQEYDETEATGALTVIQEKAPVVFSRIREFALNAASSGTGSFLYEIIMSMAAGGPK